VNIGASMQLHHLKKPEHIKGKKRIGRGGKRGRYCGKGDKGQRSRAGAKIRPQIRDWIKSIPKLRGYKFDAPKKEKPETVNVKDLDYQFKKDEKVNPETLAEKGLIEDKRSSIKILGDGEIETALKFEDVSFSESSKKKIKDAGGSVA